MRGEFQQVEWGEPLAEQVRVLACMAIAEDLGDQQDWTTTSLVPTDARASATIAAREAGVLAGLPVIAIVLEQLGAEAEFAARAQDGDSLAVGQAVGTLSGSAADLLTAERILLNFLGRMSGIASLTRQFVDAVSDTSAKIYDTRKTTPAWRILEKYAVRCGGGSNHRLGLHKAVMIKDNHIALAAQHDLTLSAAISKVRAALTSQGKQVEAIEVEVDTLEQLGVILRDAPDIVLLDNMSNDQLRTAVAMRNEVAPDVVLEASGRVNLQTVGEIATTGVDRISSGALTHSARVLDLGLDWNPEP